MEALLALIVGFVAATLCADAPARKRRGIDKERGGTRRLYQKRAPPRKMREQPREPWEMSDAEFIEELEALARYDGRSEDRR